MGAMIADIEARIAADITFPVSLAEMRQPEEREKNAAMKAAVEAIGQSPNKLPDDPNR